MKTFKSILARLTSLREDKDFDRLARHITEHLQDPDIELDPEQEEFITQWFTENAQPEQITGKPGSDLAHQIAGLINKKAVVDA